MFPPLFLCGGFFFLLPESLDVFLFILILNFMNDFPYIFLKSKEENEIKQGFPWIFENEISSVKYRDADGKPVKVQEINEAKVADGSVVEIYAHAGGFLGTGVYNGKSKIKVRLIGYQHADRITADTSAYWEHVVGEAVNARRLTYSETDSYRLVFAEADFIPGFIAERYVSDGKVYIVVQFLALACERFRKEILSSIEKFCKPYGIFERSDLAAREKEGLEERIGWIGPKRSTDIIIEENGVKLNVDLLHGQKTGYFLDQKFNRKSIWRFCHGKRVLDTFSHTGAFGLNACLAGAKQVTSVDISEDAVEMINKNIKLNGVEDRMNALAADVFDLLKKYEETGEKFDVIILDPPAFTKSAKLIQKAYGGYKEINLRAMRLLNEGGILVSCSCSYYFDSNMFYSMLMHAAMDSHKRIQVLEKRGAGPDHSVLLGYPKSEYLKCAICRITTR